MNAFHSSSSDDGEYLGEACGIVIRLEDGRAIYFAGDTCVFGDMALIARLYAPDYAVLPIGDHFTMGPREAAVALELLGNPPCVPCHYGTFPLLTGTPEQLRDRGAGRDRPRARAGRDARPLMPDRRRDLLDRRLRPRRRAVGRRDPVEVPRRRLGRAVGRARGVGAIATQAYANPRYGPDGLALLARGPRRAQEVVARLTAADDGRDHRQLGVVDAHGGSATLHRRECMDWAGGVGGPLLRRAGEHPRLRRDGRRRSPRRSRARAGRPLAERLIDCLAAAQAAGGDRRGQQSAALLVVERDGGYAGLSDSVVDLRVDDHAGPGRGARAAATGSTSCSSARRRPTSGSRSTTRSRRSCASGSPRLGYDGDLADAFRAWAGRENLEERVDGIERIDPVVLEELRRAMSAAGRPYELDELDSIPLFEGIVWHPVRRRLGIRAFGINAYTSERSGEHVVEEHDETGGGAGGHEEVYVVIARPRDLHARRRERSTRRRGRSSSSPTRR